MIFSARIIADVSADGGFTPPFFLDPIDFGALYVQQRNNVLAQQQTADEGHRLVQVQLGLICRQLAPLRTLGAHLHKDAAARH